MLYQGLTNLPLDGETSCDLEGEYYVLRNKDGWEVFRFPHRQAKSYLPELVKRAHYSGKNAKAAEIRNAISM